MGSYPRFTRLTLPDHLSSVASSRDCFLRNCSPFAWHQLCPNWSIVRAVGGGGGGVVGGILAIDLSFFWLFVLLLFLAVNVTCCFALISVGRFICTLFWLADPTIELPFVPVQLYEISVCDSGPSS